MIRTCFLKILHRLLISKRRFLILGFLIGHCLLIGIAGNIYLPFQLCAVKHGQNLPLYNLIPFLYVHLKNLCMDIRHNIHAVRTGYRPADGKLFLYILLFQRNHSYHGSLAASRGNHFYT